MGCRRILAVFGASSRFSRFGRAPSDQDGALAEAVLVCTKSDRIEAVRIDGGPLFRSLPIVCGWIADSIWPAVILRHEQARQMTAIDPTVEFLNLALTSKELVTHALNDRHAGKPADFKTRCFRHHRDGGAHLGFRPHQGPGLNSDSNLRLLGRRTGGWGNAAPHQLRGVPRTDPGGGAKDATTSFEIRLDILASASAVSTLTALGCASGCCGRWRQEKCSRRDK